MFNIEWAGDHDREDRWRADGCGHGLKVALSPVTVDG
jgi:hypothetical protein